MRTQAESPSRWLGFLFGRTNGRRLIVAFAIAIALHEIAAMLWPTNAAPPRPETVAAVKLLIQTKPTPQPTPKPTPRPTIVPQPVISHVVNAGASAPKAVIKRIGAAPPKVKTMYHSKPVWDLPNRAQGSGAGKSGTVGSVGKGGNGNGQGASGSGPGICGFVDFSDPHGSQYDKRTGGFFVDIRLTVRYSDGHTEDLILDYPFYYPDEASNPWSDRNINNPDFVTLFQFPPASKRASEPPIVQYVMAHTTDDGHTTLNDCPSDDASPTPQ